MDSYFLMFLYVEKNFIDVFLSQYSGDITNNSALGCLNGTFQKVRKLCLWDLLERH